MSSSMQNEKFKLMFTSLIVFILFTTIRTASAAKLVDMPLKIPGKSASIYATLSDTNGDLKLNIQEFISASDLYIKGKIVISREKDSHNIHYNTDAERERLVIHGTSCLPFTFKENWDKTLPGIKNPLTNTILLLGPSILYRLDHQSLVWKAVDDKDIRGTMMKGATTEINKRLKITYYYKKHYDDDSGIQNPSRIEFSGYDPSSTSSSLKENLILDIYIQNENSYDEFVNEVQPSPGIGCPYYLSTHTISLPRLSVKYVHYTMSSYTQGSISSKAISEVFASEEHKLLRIKTNLLGVTTEDVYDYNLGLLYRFKENGLCSVLSATFNSPGINDHGFFYLDILLNVDQIEAGFRYIGKLNLEHRFGMPVDAWEKIKYDVIVNGKMVDKAVITQYFAQSEKEKIFFDYTLVSTSIVTYKLDSSDYVLIDKITRDYMNFDTVGSEDEIHGIFSLKECKGLNSDKTLTLGFQFQCEGDPSSCNENIAQKSEPIIENFMHLVIGTEPISRLRIDSVTHNFNGEQFEIEVTFLDKTNLQHIFKPETYALGRYTFIRMRTVKAKSENECLDKASKVYNNIKVLIYRPSDSICGYLTDTDELEEDTKAGQQCNVYQFPSLNLYANGLEVPLDKIHDRLLNSLGWRIQFTKKPSAIKIIDVVDKTASQGGSNDGLQYRIKTDAKLKSDGQVTVTISDAKTFSDCYRICHNSDQLACNTFSFCLNGDSVECRVSSLLTQNLSIESNVEQDKTCSIYALNVLNDYSEVLHRKFKTQTSTRIAKSIDFCAESCHASSDCISFQYCGHSCSFGGFYTDADTEYDEECRVYFPKATKRYQKTGSKIISDVIHTEMNLTLEQCASLCYGWSDGNTGCKSFNYCPKSKTESSCSLTQFSVKSSVSKTIEGGICSNYELKEVTNDKKSKGYSLTEVTKGTSVSGAFGIIMLFLFVGALLGFVAPIAYTKVEETRGASETYETFAWQRQVNEQIENHELIFDSNQKIPMNTGEFYLSQEMFTPGHLTDL